MVGCPNDRVAQHPQSVLPFLRKKCVQGDEVGVSVHGALRTFGLRV